MFSSSRVDPQALLEHAGYVRGLAGRLARDAHEADDLAQETWLAFLLARWSEIRYPRRFLAGVLRKRFRLLRRSSERRRIREEGAGHARIEGITPSVIEALEKAELARELVGLVLELEEPFRSAILLRFGEELPPRAIAARLGVPVKTVESRIQRGLARLRARWERRHGKDGTTWLSALSLLSRWPGPAPTAVATGAAPATASLFSLGVLLVNTKLVLACLAVAGGGGLLWLLNTRSPASDRPSLGSESRPSTVVEGAPAPSKHLAPPNAEPESRQALAPGPPASVESVQETPLAPSPTRTLHGRVLDPEARPLGGIEVVCDGGAAGRVTATSAADGSFELAVPFAHGDVKPTDAALETLITSRVKSESEVELLVVVAPHRALAGRAIDDSGAALANARVSFQSPEGFLARFEAILDAALTRSWSTTTDLDGRFTLERVPILADARVLAAVDGYAPASVAVPSGAAQDLTIALKRHGADGTVVAGRVVDPSGQGSHGAWVSLGARSAVTDTAGGFVLDRNDARDACELIALQRGYLPARFRADVDPATGEPDFPAWVELELGAAPLSLSGVVVDGEGRARAGIRVWLEDPTRFGILGADTHAQIEYLLASETDPADEFSGAFFSSTWTDGEGRFELHGLLAREYTLRFFESAALETITAGPYPAGRDDLRIVFARGERKRLEGRVATKTGMPLGGVQVYLFGAVFGGIWEQGGATTTDDEGRFALDGVGNARLALSLRRDDAMPLWLLLDNVQSENIEIVLDIRCNAKVEVSDPDRADAFRVLDEQDEPLELYEIGAEGIIRRDAMELVGGRSVTFGVADDACTLVLLKGESVVERVPLNLVPDRLNVLAP